MSWHTLWNWQPTSPFSGDNAHSEYKAEIPGASDNIGDDSQALIDLGELDDPADLLEQPDFDEVMPTVDIALFIEESYDGHEYRQDFQDWFSFVAKAESGKCELPRHERDSITNTNDFAGCSFDEAIKLTKIGWPEGLAKMKDRMELIKSHIPARKLQQELRYEQTGPGTIDMERLKQGHPEPWVVWRTKEDMVEGDKIVRILYNAAASAFVSTERIFQKGAMICTLIDLLERSGKRVELVLADVSQGRTQITTTVMVKKANDILDMDRLAFALAHSACLRRLGFSIMEQAPKQYRDGCGIPHGGYGRPLDLTTDDQINIPAQSLYDIAYDINDQIGWLRGQLFKQGIVIELEESK